MIRVWILGNFFQNWNDLKDHYQYSMLIQEFKKRNCDVKFINTTSLIIRANSKYIEYENELLDAPDIALLKSYVVGSLWKEKMRKLQSLGTFILNNPDNTIEYADKVKMYEKLNDSGLSIPNTASIKYKSSFDDAIKIIENKIGWPCVIKPNYGWSSGGIFTCTNANDVKYAIENMDETVDNIIGKNRPKITALIIQELVKAKYILAFTSAGEDILHTTMIYGKYSHLYKTSYKHDPNLSFFEKYQVVLKCNISEEVRKICIKSLDALGLDLVRGEILVTEDDYKICEINGTASFGIPSIACKENIAKDIVEYTLNRYTSR